MRWTPGGRSADVEDVRGEGGGSGFRIRGPHLGIGGFLVVLVLSLVFKRDFFSLLGIANVGEHAAPRNVEVHLRRCTQVITRAVPESRVCITQHDHILAINE